MNNNIQSLVEEALEKIRNRGLIWIKEILTDLATKASQNCLQPLPDVDLHEAVQHYRQRFAALRCRFR